MPMFQVPAIDQSTAGQWSQQDVNLYQKLPFYLVKTLVDYVKTWSTFGKLTGKIRWQPNMGTTMRGERKVPSPNLRQFANPNPLTGTPKVDVLGVRSTVVNEVLYWQDFESQYLNFLGSFQDFMNDHVERTRTDIQEKMNRYNEVYLRGKIYGNSPKVFLPNRLAGELMEAPVADAFVGADTKNTAWHQAMVAQLGNPGNLSLDALSRLLTIMSTDLRAPCFTGSDLPKDDVGLQGKYVLICSTEAFERFTFDPYVKTNKTLDFDIVTNGFKGSIFGRITCRLEDMPLRFKADGTFPEPETIEVNPAAYNYNETIPNSVYTDPVQTPYEIAFLCGDTGYDSIQIGPPPEDFRGDGVPEGFGRMTWNGEIQLTKDILIPVPQEDGTIKWESNKRGRYLQLISTLTLGCVPKQRRWIVPIIFKRVRGN